MFKRPPFYAPPPGKKSMYVIIFIYSPFPPSILKLAVNGNNQAQTAKRPSMRIIASSVTFYSPATPLRKCC